MVIIVQNIARRWCLLHPDPALQREFMSGAEAFDAAAALALDHHGRTGSSAAVRVEAFSAGVEALRVG